MQKLNIFQSLLFIQDKHKGYFNKHHTSIMHLVHIEWRQPLKVALIEEDIPIDLKNDIELLILQYGNN
jgi:hypothetical protein